MNWFLKTISIICLILFSHSFALGKTITLPLYKTHQYDHNDESDFGHRTPPKPITAVIDFDSNEISISQPLEDIESYEVWTEDQTMLLYYGVDESEFIDYIGTLNQSAAISINGSKDKLIGYIYI